MAQSRLNPYSIAIKRKIPKILIVDDNPTNVDLMVLQLKPFGYELKKAYNGKEALDSIKDELPDLVLLDLMMPEMSGYEVCEILKKNRETMLIPVIIITALKELDDKIKAIELGADDFLMKPYNKMELTTRVRSLLRLKQMYDDLDDSEHIIFSLADTLEAKDVYTRGHSERVARYSAILARSLDLNNEEIEIARRGALLHDIGKVGIKDSVLNKPGKLTPEELAHIRTHPSKGYEICKNLRSFQNYLPLIRSHHERYDGRGYPDGLEGDNIPILARVCAITDTFDAMTTDRSYRTGIAPVDAVAIMEKEIHSGQWDSKILKKFIDIVKEDARRRKK